MTIEVKDGSLGVAVRVDSSAGEGVPPGPRLKAPGDTDTREDEEPTNIKEGDCVRVESMGGEKEGREDWEALGVIEEVGVEKGKVGVDEGVWWIKRGVRVGTCVTTDECDEEREGREVREGRSGDGVVVAVKEGVVEGVVSIVEVEVEERV